MTINVKVKSYRKRPPDEDLEASFDKGGGTLGRSSENRKNHLTLKDPQKFISRNHAVIAYLNGSYHLTDTSKDGTEILNKNIRLCNDTAVLDNGDRLRIGDYELIVHISGSDIPAEFDSSPEKNSVSPEQDSLFKATVVSQPGSDQLSKTAVVDRLSGSTESSPLQDPFVLPDLEDAPRTSEKIPENFDFSELIADVHTGENPPIIDNPVRHPIPIGHTITGRSAFDVLPGDSQLDSPSAPLNSPVSSEQDIKQDAAKSIPAESGSMRDVRQKAHLELCKVFMDGAGLKYSTFQPNESAIVFMKNMGTIVREMIGGLMVLLQGRAELKSAFRLSATAITPADNNPLKSFKIVDETVDQLLTDGKPGFLAAQDAVQDAFTDIQNHQMAMTAGLQTAIIKLIERFDPQHFASQKNGGVVFHRKAKSWEAYEQFYARVAAEALEDFFGESFAQGYEKQIRKLLNKKAKGT